MADRNRELIARLTPGQQARVQQLLAEQQGQASWHGGVPVLVLERCWLRLRATPVEQLARLLPPDSTAEAPELVRFRALRQQGLSEGAAQAHCWEEFGPAACQLALRRHWQALEGPHHGWTLDAYLTFLRTYRARFAAGQERPLPLLVLGRRGSQEPHRIHWLVETGALDAAHLPPD